MVNFVFAGDFLGLQSALMGEMKHTTEATTDMVLCVFDRNELWNLFRTHPGRGYDLTFLGATEEHFLGDALATLGQREAIEAKFKELSLRFGTAVLPTQIANIIEQGAHV